MGESIEWIDYNNEPEKAREIFNQIQKDVKDHLDSC